MTAVIDVRSLAKRYGDFVAVEDVTFSVDEGEIFGILGPNGAGKTTTVECLQGLRRPDGGEIQVLGLDPLRAANELRRRIGSQLQESALPDRLKVWEALDLFGSLVQDGPSWEQVLHDWGLAPKRDASFASLSGGQQQRLFIALAMVNEPELVFLDEMTTGLDPLSRRLTWDLVRQVRDRGATVVLVTHFMDEAEALCNRIAIIDQKRVVALDTPEGLVAAHGGGSRVTFSTDRTELGFLDTAPGVERVVVEGRRVVVTGTGPLLAHVAAALMAHGMAPPDLEVERPSLEDVFLIVTEAHD